MTPTFNSDLYVVAATVIPVYFLALLLPGGVLARYAVWAKTWRSEHTSPDMSAGKLTVRLRIADVLHFPANAAVILGVWGEIAAVVSLNDRRAAHSEWWSMSMSAHFWVMCALVGMPILTAVSLTAATSFEWATRRFGKRDNASDASTDADMKAAPIE